MCKDMPVSVKVYYGSPTSAVEIRRFIFRPEQHRGTTGIYQALLERIRALFNGLNLRDVHLCWKDDDGDYVVFSSDDELRVAITNTTDNTLRIYIREKELPVRVAGASGSSSGAATSSNNASNPVTLATAPGTSRRPTADPATHHEKHHKHHYHSREVARRSGRSESSPRDPRDATPTSTIRQHRSAGAADNLSRDVHDHLHLDDQVLMVAVDQPPSSPHVNHVGEKHSRSANTSSDDHSRDTVCTSSNFVTATSGASSSNANSTNILCSECRGEGRGVWYRCTVCVDFYLCSDCENRGLHDQHIMVRITSANSRHSTPNYYHR